MTKEEATKKLADIIFNAAKSGYMPYDTNDEMCAMNIAKKHIDKFYTSIPSNLDEAAEEIVRDWLAYGDGEFEKLVISGAEWMAGQGETVEGYIAGINEVAAILAIPRKEHNKGDKVVVQIRKK